MANKNFRFRTDQRQTGIINSSVKSITIPAGSTPQVNALNMGILVPKDSFIEILVIDKSKNEAHSATSGAIHKSDGWLDAYFPIIGDAVPHLNILFRTYTMSTNVSYNAKTFTVKVFVIQP